jgi:hypothetical protein
VRILTLLNSAFDASFAIAICIMVRNNMLFNVAFKERLQYLGGCTLYATQELISFIGYITPRPWCMLGVMRLDYISGTSN